MERQHWRKVTPSTNERPSPRWGHSCCKIGEDLVFFGGYADSNYMNDVWIFHAASLNWQELRTFGNSPALRSNCSISYDAPNNRILIFGGGSSNKTRFNTISILDWNTKTWSEVQPKESQAVPWERTYHVAEFYEDFLIVFGGEGVADLDDLWVYDFRTAVWSEVVLPAGSPRPCARRFHTSALIKNQMFVIAGCHSKYRCLHDIYSLDLTNLQLTRDPQSLRWRERKMIQDSFLTRWGHSTAVFDSQIYIFGGRFGGDLNDILVFDPSSDTLRTFKIGSKLVPSPRRRHCAAFLGSSMLVFGGFNGEYFNDLHYINVYESGVRLPPKEKCAKELFKKASLADRVITTIDQKTVPIHSGILSLTFNDQPQLDSFLHDLSQKTEQQVLFLLQSKWDETLNPVLTDILTEKPLKKNKNNSNGTVIVSDDEFRILLNKRRNHFFSDGIVTVGEETVFVNKMQLSVYCPFFQNAFKGEYARRPIEMPIECPILFEIMLLYLQQGTVVAPESLTHTSWMQLYGLADYLTLTRLSAICQAQVASRISDLTLNEINAFCTAHSLTDLAFKCLDHEIKNFHFHKTLPIQQYILNTLENHPKRLQHYNLHKFDLINLERAKTLKTIGEAGSKALQTIEEEKQNRQVTNH